MSIYKNNKMQLRNRQYLNSQQPKQVIDELNLILHNKVTSENIKAYILLEKINLLLNIATTQLEQVITIYNIYNFIYISFEKFVLFKDIYDLFIKKILERIPVLTEECLESFNSEHTYMYLKCIKELAKVQELANKLYFNIIKEDILKQVKMKKQANM